MNTATRKPARRDDVALPWQSWGDTARYALILVVVAVTALIVYRVLH